MKLLFLTDNFPPEVNAPATRTFEHCIEWVRSGADVKVITCAPNFPKGILYPGYKNNVYTRVTIEGIEVVRLWTYITKNEGFFRRTLDYMSFALSSFIYGLFAECDIVIATSPQFFTTFSAFGLSKIKRKPWVFELRDLWPESIKAVGAMNDGRIFKILEKTELFLYNKSALVIALTDAFKKNLICRGVLADKIKVVPNGSNSDNYFPRAKNTELLKKLNLVNKFVVSYVGTHGMAHSLDFIVKAIANLNDPEIHFLFIGDGAEKEKIMRIANENNINNNATFLDPVPKAEVGDYLSIIDAGLVPLKKSDTFKTVIPSKIFESAAMGKPILLGVEGQAKRLLKITRLVSATIRKMSRIFSKS